MGVVYIWGRCVTFGVRCCTFGSAGVGKNETQQAYPYLARDAPRVFIFHQAATLTHIKNSMEAPSPTSPSTNSGPGDEPPPDDPVPAEEEKDEDEAEASAGTVEEAAKEPTATRITGLRASMFKATALPPGAAVVATFRQAAHNSSAAWRLGTGLLGVVHPGERAQALHNVWRCGGRGPWHSEPCDHGYWSGFYP